jgi:Acetyltransferase (GNAT) domain
MDQSGPFQQSAPYAVAAGAMGARVGQGVFDGVPVQWLDRRGLRLISRSAAPRGVLRHLARHGGVTVATGLVQGFGLVPLLTDRFVALWDVVADPAVLRAQMNAKWRGHLTQAEARVQVRRGGRGCLATLLEQEGAQRAARGYRALPAAFALALPTGALRLWEWRHGGQMQAAMCFVRHGDWATYHISWASDVARSHAVHQVMLWHAMCALRDEGVRTIDLGDVNTDANPGLARFKLGTGAGLVRVGQTAWVLPG